MRVRAAGGVAAQPGWDGGSPVSGRGHGSLRGTDAGGAGVSAGRGGHGRRREAWLAGAHGPCGAGAPRAGTPDAAEGRGPRRCRGAGSGRRWRGAAGGCAGAGGPGRGAGAQSWAGGRRRGPLRRHRGGGRGLGRAPGAGKAKPKPKPGPLAARHPRPVSGSTPPLRPAPTPGAGPSRRARASLRSRAARAGPPGLEAWSPAAAGARAFMGTRLRGWGAEGRGGAAGAAEEVTCAGGGVPCVLGGRVPRAPAEPPGCGWGSCRGGGTGGSCGVQSLLSLKEHPAPHTQGRGRAPLATSGGGEAVG